MANESIAISGAERIPAALNVSLSLTAWIVALFLLWAASHAGSVWQIAACAILFSFVGNTIFSLLHESVHGILHPRKRVNELVGTGCAAFFPTGLSLQRALHLGHHRRNRTEVETFDYYYPEDSRLLKTVQWYGIISGVYWFVVVAGWLVYLVSPLVPARIPGSGSPWVRHTSGPAYLSSFAEAPPLRARLELLLTIVFQVAVFLLLDLSLTGWFCCYVAFGINWSALQYADHAYSELDVREGAWDLRVNGVVRALFLNYHLHLAHHRNPQVPWLYLPRHVDESRPRPSFLRLYASMWKGPRPAPGPPANME